MQRILLADHKELELVEDEIAAGDKTFGIPDGDAIREDLNRDVARKIIHELSDDLGLVAADVGGRCAHLSWRLHTGAQLVNRSAQLS